MTKKLFIQTYGCQMNEYDSSRIIDLLNFEAVQDPAEADVILINTCSVREKPQEKVFSDLGRFRLIKNKKPHLIIGVGGCVASQSGKEILKRAPFVDIIFGPQTLHRLPQLIQQTEETGEPVIDISFPEIEKFDSLPKRTSKNPSASVTIMEGCNNYCSYCIVPFVRGKEVSRPFADIMQEIETLTHQGAKEIILLGQNVNNYRDHRDDLSSLIEAIANLNEIGRIRFITSHPATFSDHLIEMFGKTLKLANHLHLPVQSGSNKILEKMRRRYTAEDYQEKIKKLRIIRPSISISTDFIVGFPGETDEDFEQTLKLAEQIGFDHSFSFMYSPRPGTTAERLKDDVPLVIKKQRLQTLLLKSESKIKENMQNSIQKILVTDHSKRDKKDWMGRTENNYVVNFKNDTDLIGKFVHVKITEILLNSLRGEIIT